jgi:cellulose synthase operon protein YhjQ
MKTVAIVSLKGGVGKTTTAANLGAALSSHLPDPVILVDCDPRNQLGMHFGLEPDAWGLAQASLRDTSWGRAARDVGGGIVCLPFGSRVPGVVREFEALASRRADLLRDGLADPALRELPLAVIDAAPWPSPLLDKVLPFADLVVVVLQPDPASFATLPSLHALLRQHPKVKAHILLNCVDGSRLGRDVRAVFPVEAGLDVLPFGIHRDQAVPEALARQRPVIETAPSSQGAEDFRCAAEWVMDVMVAQPAEHVRPSEDLHQDPEPPRVSGVG